MNVEKFDEWAIVEIMGHKRFAGRVTEQSLGGVSFVRIDVPLVIGSDGQTLPPFTKLFGAASIYCISPCTEETARLFACQLRAESFSRYEAPRLPAPTPAPERDPEWDADNDDLEADEEALRKATFIVEGLEPLPITPVPECSRKYVSGIACLLCGDGACFQIAARPDLDPDDGDPF